MEWNNLANQTGCEAIEDRFREYLPQHDEPDSPGNSAAGREKPQRKSKSPGAAATRATR
jgi:hypothetical protein